MSKKWMPRGYAEEVRAYELPEDSESLYIEGYALRYNTPSLRLYHPKFGEFTEIIAPGALRNTDLSDVKATDNHGRIFARTRLKDKPGGLELTVDDVGLFYRARLSKKSTRNMDFYEDVKDGLYHGSSFEFIVPPEGQMFDKKTRIRTLNDIAVIRDVSPVYDPAYTQSTVEARSAFEMEIDEAQRALESAELQKRRIILLSQL